MPLAPEPQWTAYCISLVWVSVLTLAGCCPLFLLLTSRSWGDTKEHAFWTLVGAFGALGALPLLFVFDLCHPRPEELAKSWLGLVASIGLIMGTLGAFAMPVGGVVGAAVHKSWHERQHRRTRRSLS